MIEKPPMSQAEAARRRDMVELRIANLRRELGAETEPRLKAAILYQVGALYEHELEQVSEAVAQYERAHEVSPDFQPALIAQLRIAERADEGDDVAALRSEQVRRATSPALSAAALIDLAMHSEDWASLLREAIARSPEPTVPALLLEWLAEARGDDEALGDALRTQASHAADPTLRAALWVDLGLHEIDVGRPDDAIAALERACESDALVWQARSLQARTAREHERWEIFVRATTAMACLLEAAVERNEATEPLSLSVPEDERLPMAAHLWQEAASCSATHLDDAEAAASYLSSALRLLPNHRPARLQALLVAERLGDEPDIAKAAAWFLDFAPDDAAFVAHQMRLAMSSDGLEGAMQAIGAAEERFPDSDHARAAREVLRIRHARHSERAEAFCREAEAATGERQARLLWHAAQLVSAEPESAGRAQSLYSDAVRAAAGSESVKTAILREALGAAMHTKQADAVLARCDELLRRELDPSERAAVEYCRYDAARNGLGSDERARKLLADAVLDRANADWAPHLARARAAWTGDAGLLAQAHEAIAELSSEAARLGHLCAAGQAYAQARDWAAAERVLRRALEEAPEDGYVVSLLDAVLREGGRTEDVVSLARERSKSKSSAALGELSLLLAGATAERGGNSNAARQAYEQALAESPRSPSAALSLHDIARLQSDSQTALRAHESLRGSELGGGVPELYAVLRGDALGSSNSIESSAAYEQALGHSSTAAAAAVALLSIPGQPSDADQRLAAEEVLLEAGAGGSKDSHGFSDSYAALRASLDNVTSSGGSAWLRLSAAAPSEGLRAGALLQGLRAIAVARGADAADELFILAQEAEAPSAREPDAAAAISEALAPTDDAELRVHALDQALAHSESLGRAALDAARCRALVEAERGAEAVEVLSAAIDDRPDDLALWETLRGAARQAGLWPMVAQSCERLAPFVDGALSSDLLEEAGVVRMDHLQQYQQAEDLFRRALEEDPSREIAFRRLRDLLVAHEDAEALEVLVSKRLALGGPKDRLELLYERARLLRGFSDRPGALEVLGELFTTKADHAGALALAAEVHVSLGHWAEAVDSLQRLSRSDIPDEQRRVAHLGAADFLESKLGEKDGALLELRAVESLGLADAETWVRIGGIEVELGRPDAGTEAYARALQAEPDSESAIAGLVELLEDSERDAALTRYESAIWTRIDAGELDASLLDALKRAADWRGHDRRAAAVANAQRALGLTAPAGEDGPDLGGVSVAALWDPNADAALQEVVLRAGPSLRRDRARGKKPGPTDPIVAELEGLCERFGGRVGSVELSGQLATPVARMGRDAEVHWTLPESARGGLDAVGRFLAGRLAWAAPHGGAELLDGSPEQTAGALAAVLRVSRCQMSPGEPALPAADVRLRRAVRKAVQEALGGAKPGPSQLLAHARSFQRSADRAGLLASEQIGASLAVVLNGRLSLATLRSSSRGIDLLRFWIDADSPLWGTHG